MALFLALCAPCACSDADDPNGDSSETDGTDGSSTSADSTAGDSTVGGTGAEESSSGADGSSSGGGDSTGEPPVVGVEVECWTTAFVDEGASCMRVATAIDPDDPGRGDLEVGVVRFPATGAGGGLPIVVLVGGPGASGTVEASGPFFSDGAFGAARAEHEVFVMDYRVVGFSEPFAACPLPESPDDAMACAVALTDGGLALSDVTSARFAADVDAVMEGFGQGPVILWGGSYGTRLASTMMRDFPERVAAAVMDGVFPIERNGFTQGEEAVASQLAFVADRCAGDVDCSSTLGDIRAKVEAFVADRPAALVDTFITQVSRLNRHGAAPLLVDTLDAATDEEAGALLSTLETYAYAELGDADYGEPLRDDLFDRLESFPMTLAIVCSEEAAFIDTQPSQVDQFGWSEAVLATFENQEGGAPFPPDVATLICDAFGAPAAADLETLPLESDIPTLIISGGQDVQTPVFWADDVADGLSNAVHHVVPLGEHVASLSNGCARDLVLEFFDAPTELPAGTCLEQHSSDLVVNSDDVAAEFAP